MKHYNSVFTNSCLNVPVDPTSRMPKTKYERASRRVTEQSSVESSSCSAIVANLDSKRLKDFYCSIPDYKDINHLPPEEFYATLRTLKEKRKIMFSLSAEDIDDDNCDGFLYNNSTKHFTSAASNSEICSKHIPREQGIKSDSKNRLESVNTCSKLNKLKSDQPKRNHSACSISWNDINIGNKDKVDQKFDLFFEGKSSGRILKASGDVFKTQSMPSSPIRTKRLVPLLKRRSITIPKPFKMTERDEEERTLNELKSLRKSFSEDMLNKKVEQRKFRTKPVPIESRIPLYNKILEDQAMRRAITKINSEAELRAQMKPFSFMKREEQGFAGLCERATIVVPKSKKKKKFKARPVPKNLFSNYFYDKMNEAEFFRSMNKRIRAEEMLRRAHYPGNMASRNRSRLSTPGAHSDLPIDPSPAVPSIISSDRLRCASPTKERKKNKFSKDYFITTSPQPFHLNTADRAAKKMEDVAKKIYEENKSSESVRGSGREPEASSYSALELRGDHATGRSNLAALLRAEEVRRRFEIEAARRSAEQRRKSDMKQRDRLLRSKPAWHLVKNNHEEDIAMRLQTRRDEERMRHEEFLHEMELMYGRVQQQPMLFERYYAPRSESAPIDTIQLSPRKTKKRNKNKVYNFDTLSRSRKVSINDSADVYNFDVADYLNRIEIDDKYSEEDSEVIDSLDRTKL